jgi:hypothetical protein
MNGKLISSAAALLLALPAGPGASGATAGKEGPRTQPLAGVVNVVHQSRFDQVTTCTGADGEYSELRTHVTGTFTSTDARVSGEASIEVWLLRNLTTLLGTIETVFEVRDSGSDAVKWSGDFVGVIEGSPSREL